MKDIEISIKDFRAVNNADIALNGITVLSGVNSSGKSTISRLLYYTFKYANDFEKVVNEYFANQIEALSDFAYRIVIELPQNNNEDLRKLYRLFRTNNTWQQRNETMVAIFQKGKEILLFSDNQRIQKYFRPRYVQIIKNILEIKDDVELEELFDKVIDLIQQITKKANTALEERNYRFFVKYLEERIGDSLDNINITEYGLPLLGKKVKNVPIMEYIQRVAYIDTPVIVGVKGGFIHVDYWDDLEELLQRPAKKKIQHDYINISEQIRGDALYDGTSLIASLKYKRYDGKTFNLFESATGIKSFSVLQILLENGFIDKNTLLIIDEPEAHLHPQWIVEYARMIVLIHKHIGAKFFIASHSPDFVSAIKYIATKEECLPSLSFYLSEEDTEQQFTYNYRSLGQNIEPIFESFNKSFALIEEYGTDND